MAERRMMSKKIIHSDAFMDLPATTKNLYFYLMIEADDDGFVNSPKKIQRMLGSTDDDAKLLMAKKFVLDFDSGVIVIKHWRIHNYIRSDRYKETDYLEEKAKLSIKDNLVYQKATDGIPVVHIGEDRIGEVRVGEVKPNARTKFEKFTDLLETAFAEHRISTFNTKINKTDKTKRAFKQFIPLPNNLHTRYAEYVSRNRSKAVRLDKWLLAILENNENDIEYASEGKGKEPEVGSIAWRMLQKQDEIEGEIEL